MNNPENTFETSPFVKPVPRSMTYWYIRKMWVYFSSSYNFIFIFIYIFHIYVYLYILIYIYTYLSSTYGAFLCYTYIPYSEADITAETMLLPGKCH